MKKTPLYENHRKLNAKMVDFGAWTMPLWYSNIRQEHKATRTKAGLFDTSHMGEIVISGKNSLELVQRLTTNDASRLEQREAQYSIMCHENGGVVDDLYVYRTGKQEYMLVVNASNAQKDLEHINGVAQKYPNVEVDDISERTAMLALQGPEAENVMRRIYRDIPKTKNTITQPKPGIIISRTGYTGEDGFELFFKNQRHAKKAWKKMMKQGAVPCGLGARDTLRLEMGYPLYGNELNDETTPLEAGLEWAVCLEKDGRDFLGEEALLQQRKQGLKRKLVGFELVDRGIARQHHKIIKTGRFWRFFSNYEVTSGTKSPTLGKSIGMCYVPADFVAKGIKLNFVEEGTELVIKIRDKSARAKVIKTPFVRK